MASNFQPVVPRLRQARPSLLLIFHVDWRDRLRPVPVAVPSARRVELRRCQGLFARPSAPRLRLRPRLDRRLRRRFRFRLRFGFFRQRRPVRSRGPSPGRTDDNATKQTAAAVRKASSSKAQAHPFKFRLFALGEPGAAGTELNIQINLFHRVCASTKTQPRSRDDDGEEAKRTDTDR